MTERLEEIKARLTAMLKSRTDVPQLTGYVRELVEEVEKLREERSQIEAIETSTTWPEELTEAAREKLTKDEWREYYFKMRRHYMELANVEVKL